MKKTQKTQPVKKQIKSKKISTSNKRPAKKVVVEKDKFELEASQPSSHKSARSRKSLKPMARPIGKVKVVGVGGGGGNAVSRMSEDFIKGVDFIAINTDAQDLDCASAKTKIYIGKNLTRGLGTGMNPELGRQAAEENRAEIVEAVDGADLVFITAGMGGGTGTGAAAVVAEAAKQTGALTVAVVTKPFTFEGSQRTKIAQEGLLKLKEKVDAMIVVHNDRIFNVINKDTSILKAFEEVDDVLRNAIRGIVEIVAMPGIVNIDFADVRVVLQEAGLSVIGLGHASGNDRSLKAVTESISSPLLDLSIEGAKGVIWSVSGNRDLKMNEINNIAKIISETVDPSAKIIFGAYHDRKMKPGQLRVTVIATGFNGNRPTNSLFDSLSVRSNGSANANLAVSSVKEKSEAPVKNTPVAGAANSDAAIENAGSEEDEWDIPTFLRKKKGQ